MAMHSRSPDFLKESSARTLVADDLQAVFLPDHAAHNKEIARHRAPTSITINFTIR